MFCRKDKVGVPDGNASNFSQKECELCNEAMGSDYFAMFDCIHTFCKDCAIKHFTILVSKRFIQYSHRVMLDGIVLNYQITERPILACICPFCNIPDLYSSQDKHVEYFSLLLASLRPILDENIMNVFEKKLTDLALVSDPNFVWCVRVGRLNKFKYVTAI